MKRWGPYLVVGIIVFLVSLVLLVPARVAYHWYADAQSAVRLSGVQGTLWNGSADGVLLNHSQLQGLHWQVNGFGLLTGTLSVDLELQDRRHPAKAQVSRALLGDQLRLEQLRGSLPAALVREFRYLTYLDVDGTLELEVAKVEMEDQQLVHAEGVITARSLALKNPIPGALGTYQMDLQTTEQGIRIQLQDRDSPFQLQGLVQLTPGRKFNLNASITPRPTADPAITALLRNVGRPEAGGAYRLQFSGVY